METESGSGNMKMSGQQVKERLERDLGFEANRARMLTETSAGEEIDVYWKGRSLPDLNLRVFTSIAKNALVAGLAGRQKLNEQIHKLVQTAPKGMEIAEISIEIGALVQDHQSTLNLSRHRASCVNAHLNVLEPDRALSQIYSAHLSEAELKKAKVIANELLKREISNSAQFAKWVEDVHELLSSVSKDSQPEDSGIDEQENVRIKKGLISRKAIGTYFKQWDLFGREKLGPAFGIALREEDASPISNRLNRLEKGASRTWTTMIGDITEVKTSTVFQKRATEKLSTTSALSRNLDNIDLELEGKPLKIQLSAKGVSEDTIKQFSKAMKAQFAIYSGKGPFNVSLSRSDVTITISIPNATKQDMNKIADVIGKLS